MPIPFFQMIDSQDLFTINNHQDFTETALEVFLFQYQNNVVYRQFCDLLKCDPTQVNSLEEIPFLPIEFFKSHQIVSSKDKPEVVFTSSGTTGNTTSRHLVPDLSLYEESFRRGFDYFYGDIHNYAVLALLPSYLEREGSSLIYMVADMIKKSNNEHSGFYLNDYKAFKEKLEFLDSSGKPVLVIGVSFALLDIAQEYSLKLKNTIIMETGGMKGRRKEMIRKELHEHLTKGFGTDKIHSEYGMTELLSQAYSKGDGIFQCPPWMNILVRDPEEPTQLLSNNKTGGLNVIDLANLHSCSFIATQDLGKTRNDGQIEILGRFDHSDIRGCNLMVL